MRRWLGLFMFLLAFGIGAMPAHPAGRDACQMCHAENTLAATREGQTVPLYVDEGRLDRSVHRGLACAACHTDAKLRQGMHPEQLAPVHCGSCHADAAVEYGSGMHFRALKRRDMRAPACAECHGTGHDIPRAVTGKTARENIPRLCGGCHREGKPVRRGQKPDGVAANYADAIHGEWFFGKHLLAAATCTDCHGGHKVLPATNPRSTLFARNQKASCAACHGGIDERHAAILKPGAMRAPPACTACHPVHAPERSPRSGGAAHDAPCLQCHARDIPVQGKTVAHTDTALLNGSAHGGIPCMQCHTAAVVRSGKHALQPGKVSCPVCHAQFGAEYAASTHGQLRAKGVTGVPECRDCHGAHGIKHHLDESAPTYRSAIPALCGKCHAARPGFPAGTRAADYTRSVHGKGMAEKGLVQSAVCTDCHNSHLIIPKEDARSPINRRNITTTCAACHRGIYRQYVQGIHFSADPARMDRLPSCVDCHSSHGIGTTSAPQFTARITGRCGGCHAALAEQYLRTMHGKAWRLGYGKAAKCSDCHEPHRTLSADDPQSEVHPANRLATCRKCHPRAGPNFAGFIAHADPHDRHATPWLFWTNAFMTALLIGVFGLFGLHTVAWFPRAMKAWRLPREEDTETFIVRFTPAQRVMHLLVVVSFLLLAATGLMLKFPDAGWARAIAWLFGGVAGAGTIHRIGAVVTFAYFFYHLGEVLVRWRRSGTRFGAFFFGKDSMMPSLDDLRDIVATVKWFAGRGPKPAYERWTYWEKFDYFAVFWGVPIIGFSGLVLWFPEWFTYVLPGWALNVAAIVHSDEALLAIGFIFTIHFFNTHLRPDSFPMDTAIFTGRMPIAKFKEERRLEYERRMASGELDQMTMHGPIPGIYLKLVYLFGGLFLLCGLALIALILYSAFFG